MAEEGGEGCLVMAILVMIILVAIIFALHIFIIYPYLVKVARTKVERYENYAEESLLRNTLDNTNQELVDKMNNHFEYTPEKIDANPDLLNLMLNDPDWKKLKFIKKYKNTL